MLQEQRQRSGGQDWGWWAIPMTRGAQSKGHGTVGPRCKGAAHTLKNNVP